MDTIKSCCLIALLVVVVILSKSDATECCAGYTDHAGEYQSTFLCGDFCCFTTTISTSTGFGVDKMCCDRESMRVPNNMKTEECLKSWIEDHIWVPIVGGIVVLIVIISLAICWCACQGQRNVKAAKRISKFI